MSGDGLLYLCAVFLADDRHAPYLWNGEERDLLLAEKFLNHGIPGMIQGFIQSEDAKGSSGGAENFFSIIMDIQKEAGNILYMQGDAGLGQQFFHIVIRQAENNFKIQRCIFPFYQIEKKGAQHFPAGKGSRGVFRLCLQISEIICMKAAVYIEGGKGGDGSLR